MDSEVQRHVTNEILRSNPQLLEIPAVKFRQVVEILEQVRHRSEIQEALNHVRPRLAQLRPPRPPTLQRVGYLPIEDLLTHDRVPAQEGLVPREAMQHAWNFLATQLEPALTAKLNKELADIHPSDIGALTIIGSELWPVAAKILSDAIASATHDRRVRRDLVGDEPERMLYLVHIARYLGAGTEIQSMKTLLPVRPIQGFTSEQVSALNSLFTHQVRGHGERAAAVLLSMAARMEVQGDIIAYAPRWLNQVSEEERHPIQAQLSAFVLGDMIKRTQGFATALKNDIADRAVEIGVLVESLAATERAIRHVAPVLRKELKSVRQTTIGMVSEIVTEAQISLNRAISAGVTAPNEQRAGSERSLIALRRCSRFADHVGLKNQVLETLDEVANIMRRRALNIIEEMGASPRPEELDIAKRNELVWAVRMLEVAGEIEEAERLWRKFALPGR